jgi:Ca2+/H+ antiporter
LSKTAYGVAAALTVAVVVELLHASALLVFALASLALDGKSNWLEGAMLCGVYAFAALVFFFSP